MMTVNEIAKDCWIDEMKEAQEKIEKLERMLKLFKGEIDKIEQEHINQDTHKYNKDTRIQDMIIVKVNEYFGEQE